MTYEFAITMIVLLAILMVMGAYRSAGAGFGFGFQNLPINTPLQLEERTIATFKKY